LKENSLIGDKLLVTTTINVFTSHEVVLPVAWSRNVARRVITLSKKPQTAKIRYIIEDRGVYRFGYKNSEYDPLLGFTININGNDKVVLAPVNPTSWVEVDVTDVIASGDNIFDGIIWRSAINLVVSFYVDFSLVLVCEDVEEVTYKTKPIQQVTPQPAIDITGLVNAIWMIVNLVVMFYLFQFVFKIIDIFEEIMPSEKK
jgi:hypothetical protein